MKRLVLVVLVAAFAATGCKQGKGERCQVNADCQSGLVCSAATGTCSGGAMSGIDATVPPQQDGGMDAPHD